jgi:MAP3K TRAFs-binding domain
MARCFVVQGFGKKTDYTDGRVLDLDASYAVIKEAVTACGVECVRADEILHSGTIDKPMYEQLLGADLVIADLSTYNVNAAFELGVRYALRPHATIVVAEEQFKPAFDVTHIVIRRYRHLGEDIGRSEARRFQGELAVAVRGILAQSAVDSPVYTFLPDLVPPQARPAAQAAALIEQAAVQAAQVLKDAPAPDAGDGEPSNKWLLDHAKAALKASDFTGAKALLTKLHERLPNDHHVVHQLTLATYKSRHPDVETALEQARDLLATIDPATTNDPETLGLWGAIHKRLWDLAQAPALLDDSIAAYGRGFQLKQDYYNGINYAMLLERRALVQLAAGRLDDAVADRVTARRTREEVLVMVAPLLARLGDDSDLDGRYWAQASAWEAHAGLGHTDDAARAEALARALNPPGWMLDTTREQIERIRRTQQELAAALAAAR